MGDETTQEKEVKTSAGGFDFNAALERVKRFTTTGIEHASIYAPSFSNFEFISRPLADARAKVDGVLVESSEVLNKSLPPPLPSLFRSHSSQLMLTTSVMAGILTAYPVRRISGGGFIKTFVYTAVFTGALVGGAAELVKYKWR
jgi:hypothetical protein